jgi:hypothetical protein
VSFSLQPLARARETKGLALVTASKILDQYQGFPQFLAVSEKATLLWLLEREKRVVCLRLEAREGTLIRWRFPFTDRWLSGFGKPGLLGQRP